MHRCHPCCTATPGLSSTADPPSYPTLSPNIYWAPPGYSALSLTIHPLLLFFQIHIESLTAQHRSCPHPRPRSHRPPGLLPCVLNVPLGHSCPTQQPQHFTHTPFMARDSPGCPPHSIPLSSTGPQCPSLLQRTGDPGQVTSLASVSPGKREGLLDKETNRTEEVLTGGPPQGQKPFCTQAGPWSLSRATLPPPALLRSNRQQSARKVVMTLDLIQEQEERADTTALSLE